MLRLRRCGCGVDPTSQCDLHPCKCKPCRAGVFGERQWRRKAQEFLEKASLRVESMLGQLTYVEVLEMQGKAGPESARERNMLNVLARVPS